jgi:hypothetical protein
MSLSDENSPPAYCTQRGRRTFPEPGPVDFQTEFDGWPRKTPAVNQAADCFYCETAAMASFETKKAGDHDFSTRRTLNERSYMDSRFRLTR